MISLDDLLEACQSLGAKTSGPVFGRSFTAIAYDSRTLRPGDLFVAVRTDRADGHDFVDAACKRGAAGVLVEQAVDLSAFGVTCIVVRDTRAALVAWARFVLARQAPEVIAVGGGLGKTTTQAAIVRVLTGTQPGESRIFQNGNLNDLFGLPVALGGLESAHEIAVLELASDRAGEMEELVRIARPVAAVITNVAPVHRDSLGEQRFREELLALLSSVPADGLVIVNADDQQLCELAVRCKAPLFRYGMHENADVRCTAVETSAEGLLLQLRYRGVDASISSPLLGMHNAYALLAASALGLARGLELPEIAERLASLAPLPGRLRRLDGVEGSTVLDDSQSASPRSVAAALETLDLFESRRLVVLGDISDFDLSGANGDESLAAQIAVSADLLLTIGRQAEQLGRAAINWGLPADRHIALSSADDGATALRQQIRSGDTVLVKGAESSRMERVVQRIMRTPSEAAQQLVRQDPGWKQRVFVPMERPTWIELDLDAAAENVELIRGLAGPTADVMIVLKADAYGHGAVAIARTALLHGARMLGVACLSEAVELRGAGIRAPVLVLGQTPAWQAREVVRLGLSATVYSLDVVENLSRAALSAGAESVAVHVKVDTGMSRLGLLPEEVEQFVASAAEYPGIELAGIFTHFATADDGSEDRLAKMQVERFRSVLERFRQSGRVFRYIHAANSAALINRLAPECNLVRVGILTYGLDPSSKTPCPDGFRPVLSFKTRIAQVKSLPAGTCVSYGCSFMTTRPSRIAVIPVGYGDGFRRAPNGWGEVLVRGQRAPVVGTVCMDMAMIDVTDVTGVKEGDEVVLIGVQGNERITAGDVARRLGTINYEVVTQILPRVPRTVP
jgi:alanine racemase